jgi:hypothetical protein
MRKYEGSSTDKTANTPNRGLHWIRRTQTAKGIKPPPRRDAATTNPDVSIEQPNSEAETPRHNSPALVPSVDAQPNDAVPQPADYNLPGQGPLADATGTVNLGSESVVADTSREPGANIYSMKNAAHAEIKFPRCDAAVRKRDGSEWELADAILAECCETGEDGVRNESYAQMEAMRQEIATNHGIQLSFERIRKLRKVASAFPPGRRRPVVSLEGHLEAGTPETLDRLVKAAPAGTTLTRKYIQQQKHPEKKAEQEQQKAERRRQREDERGGIAKRLQAPGEATGRSRAEVRGRLPQRGQRP